MWKTKWGEVKKEKKKKGLGQQNFFVIWLKAEL